MGKRGNKLRKQMAQMDQGQRQQENQVVSVLERKHRVTLLPDHTLNYPEMYLDIYIAGDETEERMFGKLFSRARCKRADTPAKADIAVFTGGSDVNPTFYGQERHRKTHVCDQRDQEDLLLYQYCMDNGIPMVGVCRGAQFLAVMQGAKLYQDVDNHTGDHPMYDHRTHTLIERVSSVHHQMVIPHKGLDVIATSTRSKKRWRNDLEYDEGNHADLEAFFYRDVCAFGVQGHPEYNGYNFFGKWFLKTIEDLIVCNPDIEWKDGVRRIKPDILALRTAEKEETK